MKRLLHKILRRLGILGQQNGLSKRIRKDAEIIPIQPELEFIVYWKELRIGKGPALILKANGKEVLKFDCFGKADGHFHVAPDYGKRIFFEEQTASAQIERTVRELKENAQAHLNNQKEKEICTIKIDQEKFYSAIEKAKKKMLCYLKTIPELEDIR